MQTRNGNHRIQKRVAILFSILLIISFVIPQTSLADSAINYEEQIEASQEEQVETSQEEQIETSQEEQIETSQNVDIDADFSEEKVGSDEQVEFEKVAAKTASSIGVQADPDYIINGELITFNTNANGKEYSVALKTIKRIKVLKDVDMEITIQDMSLSSSVADNPPFELEQGAIVNLVLDGNNSMSQTTSSTSPSANNAALSVPGGANITIGGSGSLTAKGGYGGAGIGGGSKGSFGTINITGGIVKAEGGDYAAGIGCGADAVNNTGNIFIGGTAKVIAIGNNYGAGIGGTKNCNADNISISDDADVEATGGTEAAGIGGGYGGGSGNIVISGGNVVANGAYTGAGIGSGRESNFGGVVTISGGNIFATGSKFGAGIGTGYNSTSISVNINGGNVTAYSGERSAGIGGGSGSNSSGGIIDIGRAATVRAYSKLITKAAIDITSNVNGNTYGDAYFVNAYFKEAISSTDDTQLEIYNASSGDKMAGEDVLLPAGYQCFAYTTGNAVPQSDWIATYSGSNFLGVTVPYYKNGNSGDTNDENSVSTLSSANVAGALCVKQASFAGLGNPMVIDVGRNENDADTATFYYPAYNYLSIPGTLYTQGGFRYGTGNPTIDGPNWTTRPNGTETQTAEGLNANTIYYMDAYFSTALTGVGSIYSNPVKFATLPKIVSGSAIAGTDAKRPLIDAAFLKNADSNAPITEATIYWSDDALDYSDLTSVITASGGVPESVTLSGDRFDDDGIADNGYMLTEANRLSGGKTYNFLVVIDNADESAIDIQGGGKSALLLAPYVVPVDVTTLTLSNTASGAFMDKNKDFNFEISFRKSATSTALTSGTFYYTGDIVPGSDAKAPPSGSFTLSPENGGKINIALKHGQSITIEGVQVDLDVQITEPVVQSYTVSFTDSVGGASESGENSTGFKSMTAARSVSFVNARNSVVPTGVEMGESGAFLMLLSMALALFTVFCAVQQIYFHFKGGKN
jgi:hypothetical protein